MLQTKTQILPRPRDADYQTLIAFTYEAVDDESRWPVMLQELSTATDSAACYLSTYDARTGASRIIHAAGMDRRFRASYDDFYHKVDPWLQRDEHARRPGTVLTGEQIIGERELMRSEFYGLWLKPQQLFHALRTVVARGDDRIVYLVSLRTRSAGPFTSITVGLHQSLSGHIRRALGIESKLRRRAMERDAAASALDRLPFGTALVDSQGRVLVANRTAKDILEQQDGLWQRHGALTASLSSESVKLSEQIASAIHGQGANHSCNVVTVSRPSGQRPFGILVLPLPATAPDLHRRLPVAVIFIADADKATALNEDSLRSLYGFTPAEARLARLLAQGRRLEEAAKELGVSLNTVRTHLKRIFGKAGTDRQADLVRVILTSAAPTWARVQTQLDPPDDQCGEDDASEEVSGEFVVAGGDPPEVLETAEHAFDEVALSVSRTRFPWTQNWLNRSVQGGPEHDR